MSEKLLDEWDNVGKAFPIIWGNGSLEGRRNEEIRILTDLKKLGFKLTHGGENIQELLETRIKIVDRIRYLQDGGR